MILLLKISAKSSKEMIIHYATHSTPKKIIHLEEKKSLISKYDFLQVYKF